MRPLQLKADNEQHRAAFNALFTAWHYTDERGFALVNTSANPQRAEAATVVQKGFNDLRVPAGPGQWRLRPEGGELELSDAQFDLLREFWEAFKKLPHAPAANASFAEVDLYLQGVPSVNAEEWKKSKAREARREADRLLREVTGGKKPAPRKGAPRASGKGAEHDEPAARPTGEEEQ